MDLPVLIRFLESLPEIRALMRCTDRFKASVGLCGGVVRNILIADPKAGGEDISLFDFVDPFGDIDLVFAGGAADGVFLEALLNEIPDADSHVWDPQTIDSRKRAAARPGTVAADKLVIWFKGLPGQPHAIEIDALGGDVPKILDAPLAVEVSLVTHGDASSQVSRLIKFARIQMNLEAAQRRLMEPLAAFAAQVRARGISEQAALTPRRSFRIELELVQLFMTIPNWNDARAIQNQLRDLIPNGWLAEQNRLSQILSFASRQDMRVGAAVYRRSTQAPLRLDFFNSDPAEEASSGMGETRIPFTRLRLNNRDERGCCPYVDFEDGIASIAWRHTNPEITRGDESLDARDFGLVAYPVMPGQSHDDARARNRRIPLLGYVRRGRSIVSRVDPAYLKLITGRRFSTFIVGLVSIAVSGGENLPSTVPPQSLAPEGQTQDEKSKMRPQVYSRLDEEEDQETQHEQKVILA